MHEVSNPDYCCKTKYIMLLLHKGIIIHILQKPTKTFSNKTGYSSVTKSVISQPSKEYFSVTEGKMKDRDAQMRRYKQ